LSEQVFSKEIPSNPELLPDVEEFIIDTLISLNVPEDLLNNIGLSSSEAISNSIVHGNKLDPNKKVFITIRYDGSILTLSFKDQGDGFDPNDVPDPTAPENILKDSGRGIHIIRSFVDELKYNFSPDGTELILKIKLN